MIIDHLPALAPLLRELPGAATAAGVAIALALLVHLALFRLLERIAGLSALESDSMVVGRLRGPARWALIALAIELAGESSPLLARLWGAVDRFAIPALLGWIAGEVIASNDDIAATPEAVNADAYANWLFRLKPSKELMAQGMLSLPGCFTAGTKPGRWMKP